MILLVLAPWGPRLVQADPMGPRLRRFGAGQARGSVDDRPTPGKHGARDPFVVPAIEQSVWCAGYKEQRPDYGNG